jgi:hypothetical protein
VEVAEGSDFGTDILPFPCGGADRDIESTYHVAAADRACQNTDRHDSEEEEREVNHRGSLDVLEVTPLALSLLSAEVGRQQRYAYFHSGPEAFLAALDSNHAHHAHVHDAADTAEALGTDLRSVPC